MKLYCGIDLHSNNSLVVVIDEEDRVVYQKRLSNDLSLIQKELSPFRMAIQGVAVESTFNWYWLVDGLMEAGLKVHLVNTAAVEQYEGLKYTDDDHDARWLAHLLRLGILPTGYIYPKDKRPIRDLLRKRSQLVRYRTAQILSIQNLMSRNTGRSIKDNDIGKLSGEKIDTLYSDTNLALAMKANLLVKECLNKQIQQLEKTVLKNAKIEPTFRPLLSVDGIGKVLGLTIMLETGDVNRFEKVGNYASYCRCVSSRKISNGKKKGEGNRKNGNKYLSWAYVEAAHFAIRYNERIKRYYQKKMAKKNKIIAIKAVAHKLSRACYHILKDQVPFDVERAFA
ncbi:IS110 family transposase [bacterium F11]|nr:IS110 family transposase [bacterium F11]